ncbi:hypothetical protein FOPG_20152 [Fusarium oxysporum f. sp. conglutinans race 2 54008]|uniref:Uncharacterized protein n=1 Tax=Fusarium oxysporum f. sp. conglutinans race 2 54008 TaxID=1089457 RepID=X0HQR0_FUSOX|nr:hypothetical protein FOPG_20152 [Fusarium oxysporum f. sp. conglutinans race 2 54008]KAI8395982.1 hypothetical protein FOFC_21512 [Fusarium oxysporum]KAI8416742.1 hypothetical protein FOFC_03055 [Fusarium oxysporum]
MLPSPPSVFALLRSPRNLASQFELATQTALPDYATVADLPQAVPDESVNTFVLNVGGFTLNFRIKVQD